MTNSYAGLRSLLLCGITILVSTPAIAQITPDNTLGAESSRLTPNVTITGENGDLIVGGATRGSNLFHSFSEFNIDDGQRVYFGNPNGIQNILTRVTGGNASNILGTLGVDGGANLFLINPNGIIFGQNARLDVRGSFVGTTANAIGFGEQGFFSATDPSAPPLLTVNPSALLFTQLNGGAIANQGFLTAGRGQSLVLAGGDIDFNKGLMAIPGGRIELAAIAGTGTVGLNPDGSLSIPTELPRADVSVFGSQIGVTAGNNSGVAIHARNLDISGNSLIRSSIGLGAGSVDSQAGNTTLDATGTVQIREGSRITNIVAENESGNSGDIRITAGSLFLNDNARLSASVFGQGDTGDIIINARDQVVLDSGATIVGNVEETGKGNRGNIHISAGSLSMTNGARISANISTEGNAGDIVIDASDRVSLGNNARIINSIQDEGFGTGGNIRINTKVLSLTDGAFMTTATFGQGNAGDIVIDARDQISLNNDANILSSAERSNGGNIRINTGSLSATGGGELYTTTFGSGKAGDILIDARDRVSFEGASSNGASRALSQVESGATGQGGNITINSESLLVDNGARIGAATFGQGNAGNIIINAHDQVVDNAAQIGAATFGQGNAGNIIIDARDSVALNNSAVILNNVQAGSGKGGDIRVNTGTLTGTNLGGLQAATSGRGNAGNIAINARDSVEFAGVSDDGERASGASSQVRPDADGNSGNVEITTGSLFMRDGAQLSTGTFGKGNAGNLIINARDRITFVNGSTAFSSVEDTGVGQGGDIRISTGSLELLNDSQLDASTFGNGDAGNIEIVATQPIIVAGGGDNGRSSAIFSTTGDNPTIPGTGSTIVGTGKGGKITITTPALKVSEGGVIDARTFNDRPGGDINLTLGTLQLLNGGQIFTTSESSGAAGTIAINANQGVTISGNDTTYFSRLNQFPNRIVQISPNSSISVRSSATGAAGNINLNTPRLQLDNQGTINAESKAVDGGDITINSDLLLLRRNSSISATAGLAQGAGNGGNITINAKTIAAVPKENSDISAKAFSGRGGNITIKTDGLFGIVPADFSIPQSDITASSQLGVQGQISITEPNVQSTQGLVELPASVLDASDQIAQVCPNGATAKRPLGEFVVTGRGSLPPNPLEALAGTTSLSPLASLDGESQANISPQTSSKPTIAATPVTIVEAQGWVKTADGKIALVASAPSATPVATTTQATCPVSK